MSRRRETPRPTGNRTPSRPAAGGAGAPRPRAARTAAAGRRPGGGCSPGPGRRGRRCGGRRWPAYLAGRGGEPAGPARGGRQRQTVPFYGAHQAGIATPAQDRLAFGSLNVVSGAGRADLRDLLRDWTGAAARMTRGPAGRGGQPSLARRRWTPARRSAPRSPG